MPGYSRSQVVAACIRALRNDGELSPEDREGIASVLEQLSAEAERAPAKYHPDACPTWKRVRDKWASEHPPTVDDVLAALASGEPPPRDVPDLAAWLLENRRDKRVMSPWQRANRAVRHWLAKGAVNHRSAKLKADGVKKPRDEAIKQLADELGGDHPNAQAEELRSLSSRGIPKSYRRK